MFVLKIQSSNIGLGALKSQEHLTSSHLLNLLPLLLAAKRNKLWHGFSKVVSRKLFVWSL